MQKGECIWRMPEQEDAVERARDFCLARGITTDDVAIKRGTHALLGAVVMVVTKRECTIANLE